MAEPTKKRRKGSGEDSEEVVVMPGPAKGSKKGTARSGPAVNGTTKSTAKGKGKAAQVNGATTETMDVDKDEEVKEDEDEQPDSPVQRPVRGATKQAKAKGGTAAAAAARHAKVEEKLNREIESLRAQLEHAEDSAREVGYSSPNSAAELTLCDAVGCFPTRQTSQTAGRGVPGPPNRA